MRFLWILIACGLIVQIAVHASAQESFDAYQCKQDCAFRFGIKRDYAGMITVPSDSLRWEGYLKCVDECDRKAFQNVFGPGTD
ncbi:MAG: hypothetical protein RDU20_16275 [Desulfomonilaceae bacterium]|nr:hypothetical protein [Desulfomonilaceae bacterium]